MKNNINLLITLFIASTLLIAAKPLAEQRILRKEPSKAAPLRKYQKGTKPRLKDLIKQRSKEPPNI